MVDHLAPLLMQRSVMAITFALFLIDGERIQLQPHMAKQRRQAAEGNAVLAERRVAFMMTDMRAHHLRRKK